MSLDIILFKNRVDMSDQDALPYPIGDREEIINQLVTIKPAIDCSDKSWGIYFYGQTSIELNIGNKNKIDVIMLHVSGSGNPFNFIVKICGHFKWFALDGSTGDYLDFNESLNESWGRWQKYRDKIQGQ